MILQVVREPLNTGAEAAYREIEDETARLCVALNCPHPHLALEPLTAPIEVWWLNEFASDADRHRVESEYARNRPLMAALERNSARKRQVTGPFVSTYAIYRPDVSRGAPWTLAGARYLAIAMTREAPQADGSVFEAPDGMRFVIKPVRTRGDADADARALGRGARVFAVRPHWGLPAAEWIAADPDFWKENPIAGRE
jgi:hypothetical protein